MRLTDPADKLAQAIKEVDLHLQGCLATPLTNLYRLQFLHLFHLLFLREDIPRVREQMRLLAASQVTRSVGRILKLDPALADSQLCVVGASGEPDKFHTISHATSSIQVLGFDQAALLGTDLSILLPAVVAPGHRALFSSTARNYHMLQRQSACRLFVRDKSGSLRPCSLVMRTNSALERGLEFIGLLECSSSDRSESSFVLLDSNAVITDVGSGVQHLFRKSENIALYNEQLAECINNCSSVPTYSASEVMACFQSVMCQTSEAKKVERNQVDELSVFSLNILLSVFSPDLPELLTLQCKMRVHCFPSLERAFFSLEVQPSKPVSSLASSRWISKLEERTLKDANLKYAQQTDEHKVQDFLPIGKAPSQQLSVSHICHSTTLNGERADYIAEREGKIKYEDYSTSSQSKCRKSEKYGLATELKNYFDPLIPNITGFKPAIVKRRRADFISSTTLTRIYFVFPIILLILLILLFIYRETKQLLDFTTISTEVAVFDAHGYPQWVCKIHSTYIDITRLYLDGVVGEHQFDKFGYDGGTREHLLYLSNMNGLADSIPVHYLRLKSFYEKSPYDTASRLDSFYSKPLEIKVYNETTRKFELVKKSVFDASRIVQKKLDRLFATKPTNDSLLGVKFNYSDSIEEQLLRYNINNPINNFFTQSTLSLP